MADRMGGLQVTRHKPRAVCLMGPTASGKTDLAVALVQRLPLEIINVDSAQIYREMDIGTGKPDPETLAIAPHRLLDFLDPAERYSAARFRNDALKEMQDIHAAGRTPLLVGGTMLYFRALRDGLAEMPTADPTLRAEIDALATREGWNAVHQRLARLDPEAAKRIHPNDPQRLQRALEVCISTGRPLTDIQRQGRIDAGQQDAFPFDLQFLSIQPGLRSVLHEKIARRFHGMVEAGLVEEVAALRDRGDLDLSLPSMRSVGYRQVWQYLDGEMRFDAMVERGIIATRQLAKRQITWLRSWKRCTDFDSEDRHTPDRVLKLIESDALY